MSLDHEERKALIDYRQQKADLALDDAAFLADAGKYGLAANRLYYALYYAASALLLSKGIVTKRHSGQSYSLGKQAQKSCGGMIFMYNPKTELPMS